jgi:hypothetical protein
MTRALIVHVLLAAVLTWGCTPVRPDPSLLDQRPEAFTNPPAQAEEPAKEPPDKNVVVKYLGPPLTVIAIVVGAVVHMGFAALSSRGGGWFPTSTK